MLWGPNNALGILVCEITWCSLSRYPIRDDGDVKIAIVSGDSAVKIDKQARCCVCAEGYGVLQQRGWARPTA